MTGTWKKIESELCTAELYIEDGKVLRGTDLAHTKTLYPYRYDSKQRCWVLASGVKYDTFRKGVKDGRYSMK